MRLNGFSVPTKPNWNRENEHWEEKAKESQTERDRARERTREKTNETKLYNERFVFRAFASQEDREYKIFLWIRIETMVSHKKFHNILVGTAPFVCSNFDLADCNGRYKDGHGKSLFDCKNVWIHCIQSTWAQLQWLFASSTFRIESSDALA